MIRTLAISLSCLGAGLCQLAAAPVFIDEPSKDRWMYGLNTTPGTRSQAPTFSALPDFTGVDDRWGFFLFAFDTGTVIPPGLGARSYRITSVRVTAAVGLANNFAYDPTYDAWNTYATPTRPAAVTDPDAGRPVELHGAGFRGTWTAANFTETSPNGSETPGSRNAYPLGFTPAGQARDVSNNITATFDSLPWAIARTDEVVPGALVPAETPFYFDIDPTLPGVSNYLAQSLSSGRIWFSLSSLQPAIQQGGEYASWITRDDFVHQLFGGLAPSLEIEVTLEVPLSIQRDDADVVIGWRTFAGFTHTLMASPDLSADSWTPVSSAASTTNGNTTHRVAIAPGKRFFRIEYTPNP
ncbi:MAG: hypothetical protein RLZ97_2386 [Verrucomicrobiota bacterium]|jgi:hypothetical protein